MADFSFISELKKRKIFRAAAIYGAVAWGLTEVIVTVVEQLFLPAWVATLSVIMFVVGFPIAMFLAWTFDVTTEGIQRTEIDSRRGRASIVSALVLLIASTAGLFLLIRPAMQQDIQRSDGAALIANGIAVLPFENVSRREQDFYLSEGLSDELRDQLGRMQGLQLAARSSSIAIHNQRAGAAQIAATLGVAWLIEGSLRRTGPRLSISVQLIDGSSGLAVWTKNYQRGRLELLGVQQDIAREVVALVIPGNPGTPMAAPATLNASANDLLLLARHQENLARSRQVTDAEGLLRAVDLYRQAADADPDSAIIHSRLAGALLFLGDIEAATEPIFRALELDPELSEVQNALGEYYWALGQPQAAAAFNKAVELDPDNADALQNLAHQTWITASGKHRQIQPEELLRRAVSLDPLTVKRHVALGDYLGKAGEFDAIPAVIERIQATRSFKDAEAYRAISWLYELIGEVDFAIAWALKARQLEPDNPDHLDKLADLFAMIDDYDTARRLTPMPTLGVLYRMRAYQELIDEAEFRIIEEPDDLAARYLLAVAYVATDAYESAIRILGPTGVTEVVLADQARSVLEMDVFMTMFDALVASGTPEYVDLGRKLAQWNEDQAWWGDIGAVALVRGCTRAVLEMHEEALAVLSRMKESPRLQQLPLLLDSACFQQYQGEAVYQEVVQDQLSRRTRLRNRLPVTLANHGLTTP